MCDANRMVKGVVLVGARGGGGGSSVYEWVSVDLASSAQGNGQLMQE